ncbi:MAG: endonuclease, partial [Verrucomicrobia bacterium]|nr:endonuclease [Verrucomicrobiota bacterium]
DLSAYRLVLYNGDDQLADDTEVLSGILSDQQSGYGTAWYAKSGIQNGSPDGIALIEVTAGQTNVLQFLSYEGGFSAADGPAKGFISEDVSIQEYSTTPIGHSLQLTGTGNVYADFTWAGPTNHTRGAVNLNQTFIPVPTLLILR